MERIQTEGQNEITWRRHLGGAVYTVKTDRDFQPLSGSDAQTRHYLYQDHLGSTDVITNESGEAIQSMSFDAWGQRRNEQDWDAIISADQLSAFNTDITNRGFTGHEQLDEVGLIHMNGRVYDPKLGRFLQADPFSQAADNPQSYNRYAYVINNPLNATDPSEFFFNKIGDFFKKFAGAIVATVTLTVCPQCLIVAGMLAGATQATVNGGNIIKGAVMGMFSGAAAQFGGPLGSAVFGGLEAELNGGSFGRSFAAAGVGILGGSNARGFAGLIRSAVAGGVASKITGGKFANGTQTGAFSWGISRAAESLAVGGDNQESSSDVFNDTSNIGEGRELLDGQVIVRKHGSPDAVVTDAELSTVSNDLEAIFSKGGKSGAQLQSAIISNDPTTIILNNLNLNRASGLNSRLMTVDLNTNIDFINLTASRIQKFSTTRILAHELGYAVLGNRDSGFPFKITVGRVTRIITPSPNVKFTDRIMQGINGSVRRDYSNFCVPVSTCQ